VKTQSLVRDTPAFRAPPQRHGAVSLCCQRRKKRALPVCLGQRIWIMSIYSPVQVNIMAASQAAAAPVTAKVGTYRPVPPPVAMADYQIVEVFKPQHKVRDIFLPYPCDLATAGSTHASLLLCKL
jgi:hypothetical protein